MCKSASSTNTIIRFLTSLCKLSPVELKDTLIEADVILSTKNPISPHKNCDETLKWNVDKDKLKTILTHVFDLLNDMDPKLMEHKKIDEIPESKQIGGETVCKSANSTNTIIRFLTGLCKMSPVKLNGTLKEANTILNTINPIPTHTNCDETLEWNMDRNKLKTVLTRVFDLLNILPAQVTKVDANNPVASTSIQRRNDDSNVKEEKKLFWRKYKNKCSYYEEIKHKLSTFENIVKVESSPQNDIVGIVQNDINETPQKDGNDLNILNNKKKLTINDEAQRKEMYELLKSRLKKPPYKNPVCQNNVKNSILGIPLHNGTTIEKKLPLIILTKCDNLFTIQLQNKKKMAEHFQSTSKQDLNKINDSNSNNTTEKMTTRGTRVNKTIDITKSFNTNVKTTTKKQRSAIKNVKHKASKKRKH